MATKKAAVKKKAAPKKKAAQRSAGIFTPGRSRKKKSPGAGAAAAGEDLQAWERGESIPHLDNEIEE